MNKVMEDSDSNLDSNSDSDSYSVSDTSTDSDDSLEEFNLSSINNISRDLLNNSNNNSSNNNSNNNLNENNNSENIANVISQRTLNIIRHSGNVITNRSVIIPSSPELMIRGSSLPPPPEILNSLNTDVPPDFLHMAQSNLFQNSLINRLIDGFGENMEQGLIGNTNILDSVSLIQPSFASREDPVSIREFLEIRTLAPDFWEPVCVGLTKETVDSIEYVAAEDENEECFICRNKFEEKRVGKLPCSHEFCEECIIRWFEKNVNCPFCRTDMRDLLHVSKLKND